MNNVWRRSQLGNIANLGGFLGLLIIVNTRQQGPSRQPARGTQALSQRDASFADALSTCWPAMSYAVMRIVPDADRADALQNAALAAWRSFAKFDPSRGSMQGWFVAIAVNEARKIRRMHSRQRLEQVPETLAAASGSTVDMDLDRALNQLPARERRAIDLYYFVGLSVREVAEVLNCPEGTVKSALWAARDRLGKSLGDDYRW